MKVDFLVEETIRKRKSVRSYESRKLTVEEKEKINGYIGGLTNPFSMNVSFCLLETSPSGKSEKLGTYGVVRGATAFIGASVAKGQLNLEALGYSFEKLILYITSLGLGTCWLGGTFQRSRFATAMNLKEGELFPVISPVGYPSQKRRTIDSVMRWVAKSDNRKDWNELFFSGDFSKPLSKEEAGEYAFVLDMVRLAPSAVNGQPWRIVRDKGVYHFYEARSMKEGKLGMDIQRVDMGIAACHFHLAALEKGLAGRFEKMEPPKIVESKGMEYLFSWRVK